MTISSRKDDKSRVVEQRWLSASFLYRLYFTTDQLPCCCHLFRTISICLQPAFWFYIIITALEIGWVSNICETGLHVCFTTFVIRVPKVYTRSAVLWLMDLRVNLILTAFDYFASGQFDLSVNLPSFRLLSCHFYFFPFHKQILKT